MLLKVLHTVFENSSMHGLLGEGPVGFRDYQEVKVQEQVQKLGVGKVSSH